MSSRGSIAMYRRLLHFYDFKHIEWISFIRIALIYYFLRVLSQSKLDVKIDENENLILAFLSIFRNKSVRTKQTRDNLNYIKQDLTAQLLKMKFCIKSFAFTKFFISRLGKVKQNLLEPSWSLPFWIFFVSFSIHKKNFKLMKTFQAFHCWLITLQERFSGHQPATVKFQMVQFYLAATMV